MNTTRSTLMAAALSLCLGAAPALAEKPEWAGQGKGNNKEKNKEKNKGAKQAYFTDEHRGSVTSYYREEYRGGHCPPGLAKKNNGCLPPGQAKKWRVGQPLPSSVVIYELPPTLVVKLGPPPAGQKYVRVAADILLIAVGTRMVIDAMSDLSRI
jgi:Ni/Co efflux regulator RcnB